MKAFHGDPMNLLDVIRDICQAQADQFRAEARAGLEYRTRRAQENVQELVELFAPPVKVECEVMKEDE